MTGRHAGRLWGLGVGPGDPELLTLKALRLLRAAAVVAYPTLEEGSSFARSIVAGFLPGGQRELPIRVPMTTERAPAQRAYDAAAVEMAGHLEAGRDVAVLCEGDPFFYGSFMYLFGRLAERFPVEVVPGVSSLTACAAVVGQPLAARNDSLAVLPAPLPDAVLRARLAEADAAAIIKLGRHYPRIRALLEAEGLAERAHYVERATLPEQRLVPLAEAGEVAAPYFSMILVHRRGEAWRWPKD
ncbi:precorrin-2/cobalt-factor-2 C20-methyltransferase [Tistlia consotensis]|uniref:Precorrin-2/cobalt-factor-2 C20-methyltransferase n=1 Tax=Tistlia consotensis USBA 355 TaxID=560819 RepID=A0A1Y6B9M5_9PROT|nr:precorrin-2 C(20)-methyltransferase [Tistlia consotensis]SME93011.1 precorrin-2/cobalt-factor-2 C20-methyltransferase [Tistlia consotensis USBA 355]SNR28393.1 precorrin-2/cobalt-factor-2 C20-methyltransferase [Tistlia consotensis]